MRATCLLFITLSIFLFIELSYTNRNNEEENMSFIKGGIFLMGASTNDKNYYKDDGEYPQRRVKVSSFLIDKTEVSNREFNQFIKESNYKTDADVFGWSFVYFDLLSDEAYLASEQVVMGAEWWVKVDNANWEYPFGRFGQQSIIDQPEYLDHPVVHISWNDANAFCSFYGKRLPTEAEWEYAARGGLEDKIFPWGDSRRGENNDIMCNTFQGKFPNEANPIDGYLGTAPVKSFYENGYGLYNMVGNVWEWVSDWYSVDHDLTIKNGEIQLIDNPIGPLFGEEKIQKGGSYLCHRATCFRFRNSARTKNSKDSSSGNNGFRCAKSV